MDIGGGDGDANVLADQGLIAWNLKVVSGAAGAVEINPGLGVAIKFLPLIGDGLNGTVWIDPIVQHCGECASLFCNTSNGHTSGGWFIDIVDVKSHRLLGCVAGVIGGDDGEGVGGFCFVVWIGCKGDVSCCGVNREFRSVVVVIGFQAVSNRGGIGCGSGIDDLVCAAVFINGGCCAR